MEQKQLKTHLADGNRIALAKLERELSFELVLKTDSKSFLSQKNEEPELLGIISQLAARFVSVNFPDTNADDVSFQFAVDVIETRPDWNILDVVYFFKFIRQRQDIEDTKVWGNKITPVKLSSLMAVYEEHKSQAREQLHRKEEERFKVLERADQKLIGDGTDYAAKFSAFAEKIVSKIKETEERKTPKENSAFKTKIFLKAMEQHWNEQMKLVEAGTITEKDAIINHQKYRLDYEC